MSTTSTERALRQLAEPLPDAAVEAVRGRAVLDDSEARSALQTT